MHCGYCGGNYIMNNSFDGNKILSFYSDAKKLIKGELVTPRFISIWLTTSCDLSCEYCYFNEKNKEKKFSNIIELKKFITEISRIGVESIEFSGGGEPTLHPDCFKIAEFASRKGLKVGLLTNGFQFDYDRIKFFDYIRIGLDASSEELYNKIKGGKEHRFTNTIRNVEKLLCVRDKDRTRIGLKFMLNKFNFTDLSEMVSLSKSLGVDYCHFKGTHSDTNKLLDFQINAIQNQINDLKNKFPDFICGSVNRTISDIKCFMSPIHTVITPMGDCLICCYFYQSEKIVGNVFKDGFVKVWHSKRHMEIIDNIQLSDCQKIDCRWAKYNSEMKDVILHNKYDLSFI